MRIEDASPEVLADLWNGRAQSKYRIESDDLRSHVLESPLLDRDLSIIDPRGFVAVKRSAAELYQGPDPSVAHISLLGWHDQEGGIGLLTEVFERAWTAGKTAVIFGMDSGHFFPGVPIDEGELVRLVEGAGMVGGGTSHDLENNLREYVRPTPFSLDGDVVFRRCEASDRPTVDDFFQREFPDRWRFDVMSKWAIEEPNTVFGLFFGGICEGFALLQSAPCRYPIGGAVWHFALGKDWGSLGPIGVTKALRGKGLGDALLAEALLELQRSGCLQTIIDWTGLVEFYGRHGFRVTRSYRSYRVDRPV